MKLARCVIAAVLALAASSCGPSFPEPLAAEAAKTPRGKATVIEFIDFQCPFCRMTHQMLTPLVRLRGDKVRVVRKHVPLRRHVFAQPAALAAVCADAQGKGDDMADALVAAPESRLRAEGCEDMAVEIGLDIQRFRNCVSDPATAARVREDEALFREVGGRGVPLLFIGGERLSGLQDEATLERTLDEAIARAQP